MKSSQRYLTVRQFADEMNVGKEAVYVWLRNGILEGVLRYQSGPYLIPESNLYIKRVKRGRPVSYSGPVINPDEARKKYNSLPKYKVLFSYDELKDLFDKGMTQKDIADLAGVSRERIRQLHAAYFAPFDVSGRERYKTITRVKQKQKAIAHAEGVDKLWALIAVGRERDLKVEPIVTHYNLSRCYPNLAKVNEHLCGVHYAKHSSHASIHRYYFNVNIARNLVKNTEFTIIFTGEDARPAFVLPSKILLDLQWRGRPHKTIYLPKKKLPAYKNQYPRIDWWSYMEAWHQLENS
jgi:hypothetical protein